MYDTRRDMQGRLKRYVVLLRVNVDLSLCPSTDNFTTHVVWCEEPYDAMSVAQTLAERLRGHSLRRVFGVEEWPHPAQPEGDE